MFRLNRILILSVFLFLPVSAHAASDRQLSQNNCISDPHSKVRRHSSACRAIDRSRFHRIQGHPVGEEVIIIRRPSSLAPNRPYDPVHTPKRRQLMKEEQIRRGYHNGLEGIQNFERKDLKSQEFL